jgi:hypothetical protein
MGSRAASLIPNTLYYGDDLAGLREHVKGDSCGLV